MTKSAYILAVDDDRDFLDIVCDRLKRDGFMVATEPDGAAALASIEKKLPDLVLMDVQMPIKDGFATVAEIGKNPKTKNLRIIFLTNLGDAAPASMEINKKLAEQVGGLGYFKKGGDMDLLVMEIKKVLNL